jgi:hypothetical protein
MVRIAGLCESPADFLWGFASDFEAIAGKGIGQSGTGFPMP